MRPIAYVSILALLMVAAVPVAIAGAEEHRRDARAHEVRADDDHRVSNETRAAEKANRTAAMEAFLAKLHSLRASWLENSTAIRESCHAAEVGENATKEQRLEKAQCIRDGYSGWRDLYRGELRELRAQFRALFH